MRTPALVLLLVLAAGCSADEGPVATPSASSSSAGLTATLDGVPLRLEVADTPEERAVGLMGRTAVPEGTGMAFLYDALSEGEFYMYRVPIPLRATFVRDGRVVSTVLMEPCALDDPLACPTYGADGPYDTVVETGADVGPRPVPGDAFVLGD